MSRHRNGSSWLIAAVLLLAPVNLHADPLRVAVASNFKPAMEALIAPFERRSGHDVAVSYGSTGKHYAQIINGAPFDVFLAADVERPARLEEEGVAVAGSRFTYAVGTLVLWSPGGLAGGDGRAILEAGEFRFLAVANPAIAPYGRAAEQTLRGLGLWEHHQARIVRGENIGQAYAFVRSGNAELGFVAGSQLVGEQGLAQTNWVVSAELYDPIEQQAVRLTDSGSARAFLEFLRSPDATAVIRSYGYSTP